MTIAVCVKVHDGMVLASDSASTLVNQAGGVLSVMNVYNHANKVFNLYKGLPIGGMTWGAGSIGRASIATLAKDFRGELTRATKAGGLDPEAYTIEDVSKRAYDFLITQRYAKEFVGPNPPAMGFLVAGYSAQSDLPEAWVIQVPAPGGAPPGPIRVLAPDTIGIQWWGQPEALSRLVLGFDPAIEQVLVGLGASAPQAHQVLAHLQAAVQAQVVHAAMPIQDAIDLAEYLVHTTIMFSRFCPGPASVGGPIEIAAITKHEQFKWVRRKHYYEQKLNPKEPGANT